MLPKKLLFVLLSLWAIGSVDVYGKNNQTFVIGGGPGYHVLANTDDTREGSDLFGNADAVNYAATVRLFGEWYLVGNFGLGVLTTYQTVSRT